MNARILVVDDEEDICAILKFNLSKEGYEVVTANSAEEALTLDIASFNLLLLDVMMGGMSGFELTHRLKADPATAGVPVIFITAKASVRDRVEGLRRGADDYLVKPFEIEELLARVETVLRRAGKGGHLLRAFDVVLDAPGHLVTQNGAPVELTPREFDLLEQLMRNRGAALYRDALYERVWGGELEDTRTLDLHIQRLRKKLHWGDKIETVYRIGYRLRKEDP